MTSRRSNRSLRKRRPPLMDLNRFEVEPDQGVRREPRNRSRNRHPVPVAVMGADQSVGHESTKSFLTIGRSKASPSVW